MIDQPTWLLFAIASALGLMIGLSKGGFSALSLLLTPLLTLLVHDVAFAVVLLLPMLLVGDALAVWAYWREWDQSMVARVLPAAAVGVVVGIQLLTSLPPPIIRILLSLFTLLAVAYRFATDRHRAPDYRAHPWLDLFAGGVTGLASGMFNAGGPPLNAYMLFRRLPPRVFVATVTVIFALLNIIKLAMLLQQQVLNGPLLRQSLQFWLVLPFIPVGTWLGRQLVKKINHQAFASLVSLLLVVSALWILWESS
jgi:uncharacterized membrane protein YfcA